MKIRVKHYSWDESKAPVVTVVEVPEGDCQIMIERDYELRKQAAKEGEEVTPAQCPGNHERRLQQTPLQ